jgi:hypothetical protein
VRTISIIQPSFLPWRGYFQIIAQSSFFLFFDDVQYDRRGWRNRNQIKSAQGPLWITVPVQSKGKYDQAIKDTLILNDGKWSQKMLGSIRGSYARAPFFDQYFPWLQSRLTQGHENLCELDILLTEDICKELGLATTLLRTSRSEVAPDIGKIERLVALCKKYEGDRYLSGPSAKEYIGDSDLFEKAGIQLEYAKYEMPQYPQAHGEFSPHVSIIDLLFNCGSEAKHFLGLK